MRLRLWQWLKALRTDALLLLFAWKHPQTPRYVKAGLIAALAYLISPIDLLPDALPGIGILDDLTVVSAMLCVLANRLPSAARSDSLARMEKARRFLPLATAALTLALLLWLGLLLWGLYLLFFQ